MSYLVEEIIPREYYTTMISLTADINVLYLFLSAYKPKVCKHLREVNFELPMVLVELFITVFTSNPTDLTDVIMDLTMIEGSGVYFKVILVFMNYFEKEILEKSDFCTPR